MSSVGALRSFPSRNSLSNASNNNNNTSNNNRSFLPSTPPTTSTLKQSSILNSIQRRVRERSNDDTFGGGEGTALLIRNLENDLQLAAQVGTVLLEEKQKLEKEKTKIEAANNVLLDRVTAGTKESALLQRRLEQAVGNLEQADANNRALLVSLEEDRKTISRLSVDSARLVSTSSQLKSTTQSLADAREELHSSHKRAEKAESRMKKYGERVMEMEERLKTARGDVEAMRQDKVLRGKKSRDALAIVKARFNASTIEVGENSEAAELLKVVESLVSENDLLKSESAELHSLLDVSRDEQSGLRLEMAERHQVVGEVHSEEEDEPFGNQSRREFRHSRTNTPLNLRAELLSPSVSQSSEFRLSSPTSTVPTSYAPHSPTSRSTKTDFSRTYSSNSLENSDYVSYQLYDDTTTRMTAIPVPHRRIPLNSVAALGVPIDAGTVPFGRGHGRRAVSVDVASLGLRTGPTSPYYRDSPPPSRPLSLVSNSSDLEDISLRKKHRPRPLSLSLGPSLFPVRSIEERAPSPRLYPENIPPAHKSISSIDTKERSPTKRPRHSSPGPPSSSRIAICIDFSTQTSPKVQSMALPSGSTMTRSRSRNDSVATETFTDLQSTTSASELSERDKDFSIPGATSMATESRTAALGALIEYTSKLLFRIQSADIASQENRLKKQNLPGNVSHLAQANLRDLLADIEGLRGHFRRLLEQERAASARELHPNSTESLTESLVVRKDFVALVKLFRDLLFETSRLRSLVNRIELEPTLAPSLRELDGMNVVDTERTTQSSSSAGGLLAPLSRMVGTFLGEPNKAPILRQPSRPLPTTKLTGSSGITSATVEVEFGKGATKQAVTVGSSNSGLASTSLQKSTSSRDSIAGGQSTMNSSKSGSQVKRDLNNIFAGTTKSTAAEPWVVLPSRNTPSSNPFGRLLSNYRPSKSSTAYAVLDSIPHRAPVDQGPQATLLERTLRPRGLSDSSIRSTFIAHANPHHRIVSPATLALSSEVTINGPTETKSILVSKTRSVGELKKELNSLSTSVISRKQSTNRLRSKPSSMAIRSTSTSSTKSTTEFIPPLPISNNNNGNLSPTSPISISISVSPSTNTTPPMRLKSQLDQQQLDSGIQSNVGSLIGGGVGSLFGNFSVWANSSNGNQVQPSTIGEGPRGERGRLNN